MAGFDHGPNAGAGDESPAVTARNSRYGLALFAVYLLLYGGFVLLSAFAPAVMERRLAGVTLAVLYGFGLIGGAFLLALLYGWLCSLEDGEPTDEEFSP